MENMTPEQALQVLITFRSLASGNFTGKDFDLAGQALQVISEALKKDKQKR